MTQAVETIVDGARRQAHEYAGDEERPLAGYATAMSVYGAAVVAASAVVRAQRRALPDLSPYEVALLGIATHKLTRIISKDAITSAIRAPFTRFKGSSAPAELAEEVRGSGVKHAVGELLTCPFCLAQWTATGFAFGLIFAPRATRLAAATMTAVAASDFLQLAYAWAQQKAEG